MGEVDDVAVGDADVVFEDRWDQGADVFDIVARAVRVVGDADEEFHLLGSVPARME